MNTDKLVELKEMMSFDDWHLISAALVFATTHRAEFTKQAGTRGAELLTKMMGD